MSNRTRQEFENAIRQLGDRDERIRQSAIATITSDPDESLWFLIESLQTNPGFRWKALCAFKFIDSCLLAALPVVQHHLHDENRLCRIAAIEIIIQIGVDAKAVMPDLINLMDTKETDYRALVIKGLASIGLTPNDTAAIEPLGKILKQNIGKDDRSSRDVVREVSALLQLIGPSAVPTFINCLRKATRSSLFRDNEYDSWLFEPIFEALEVLLPQSNGMGKPLLDLLAARTPVDFRRDVLDALGCVNTADVDRVVRGLVKFRTDPASTSHK